MPNSTHIEPIFDRNLHIEKKSKNLGYNKRNETQIVAMKRNYLTRKEVAAHFGVSLPTVDSWRKSKRIGCLQIGGRIYFTERHLANFEKRCEVEPIAL